MKLRTQTVNHLLLMAFCALVLCAALGSRGGATPAEADCTHESCPPPAVTGTPSVPCDAHVQVCPPPPPPGTPLPPQPTHTR